MNQLGVFHRPEGDLELETVKFPICDSAGQVQQIGEIYLDVTRWRRLERDAVEIADRQGELLTMQREFVSMISHEFRTPLTAIQGAHYLLRKRIDQTADEKVTRYLELQGESIQVLKDSPVQSLADLAGKKIAIAALRAPPHLGVKMLLERAGVDLKTVTFLEMPYGAQVDALRGKQIDALATVDPFTTQLRISGLGRVISWNYVESVPEQPLGAFYTRTDYAARNEAVLDKFVGALHEAMDYLNADETRARVLIAEYSGLDPKLLAEMPLNAWDYRIKPEVWQRIVDMLVANAELQSAHKVDDFLSDYIRARLK